MRPSHRYAAVVAGVVGLGVGAGLWWYAAGTPAVGAEPGERRPLTIERQNPPAAVPSEQTITQMLDRVEAAEVERFGEEEAARRRRTREELLETRLERKHE